MAVSLLSVPQSSLAHLCPPQVVCQGSKQQQSHTSALFQSAEPCSYRAPAHRLASLAGTSNFLCCASYRKHPTLQKPCLMATTAIQFCCPIRPMRSSLNTQVERACSQMHKDTASSGIKPVFARLSPPGSNARALRQHIKHRPARSFVSVIMFVTLFQTTASALKVAASPYCTCT